MYWHLKQNIKEEIWILRVLIYKAVRKITKYEGYVERIRAVVYAVRIHVKLPKTLSFFGVS